MKINYLKTLINPSDDSDFNAIQRLCNCFSQTAELFVKNIFVLDPSTHHTVFLSLILLSKLYRSFAVDAKSTLQTRVVFPIV